MAAETKAGKTLADHIDAVEEAYEYMLAYAAQGRRDETGGSSIRDFLRKADGALDAIAAAQVESLGPTGGKSFAPFLAVMRDDATKAQAAIRLALSLPVVSSQIVDNLNASIHLRALLTDLFLVDEALKGEG